MSKKKRKHKNKNTKSWSLTIWWLLSVALLCVCAASVLGFIGLLMSPEILAEEANPFDPEMASVMCEDFMRKRLIAPATAEFAPWSEQEITQVKDKPETYHAVKSYVDAQNRYGAVIRSHFLCVVDNQMDGNWTLERLEPVVP